MDGRHHKAQVIGIQQHFGVAGCRELPVHDGYVQLVGAHHIIKIFYGVRNDIDVYAGRLVAVFGQHLRHTAFAHGVGDAHPDVRHADAAVLDGLAGVAVYSQRPAGVFYQNLAFRRQAQFFFILIKYMNAELLLQLAHMMADSGLCERKPLCRPCVTARTDDLQEGLYLRIKHFAPQFIKKIYMYMKSHNLILS